MLKKVGSKFKRWFLCITTRRSNFPFKNTAILDIIDTDDNIDSED